MARARWIVINQEPPIRARVRERQRVDATDSDDARQLFKSFEQLLIKEAVSLLLTLIVRCRQRNETPIVRRRQRQIHRDGAIGTEAWINAQQLHETSA